MFAAPEAEAAVPDTGVPIDEFGVTVPPVTVPPTAVMRGEPGVGPIGAPPVASPRPRTAARRRAAREGAAGWAAATATVAGPVAICGQPRKATIALQSTKRTAAPASS